MRIVFLCTSFEYGYDGVGDYTRLIVAEIIKQGNFAAIIALNDKYVTEVINVNIQFNGVELPLLRLPAALTEKERFNNAKEYIINFKPDWLSLQFVIFGYHPKGLPFGLVNNLALIGKGMRWHIMFHELWVGMEKNSGIKKILWGQVQQYIISNLIATLQPKIIHTNTQLYQCQLKKIGVKAEKLSLFGNIPRVKNKVVSRSEISDKTVNFLLFGNIHANVPFRKFANDVSVYAKNKNIDVSLTFLGRCGEELENWVNECKLAEIKVDIIGERPVNDISQIMEMASIGISTTPISLIEKSGSVAAMLEHGLPVVCIQPPWYPKRFKNLTIPQGIVLYREDNIEDVFIAKSTLLTKNTVSAVAHKLVNALNNF